MIKKLSIIILSLFVIGSNTILVFSKSLKKKAIQSSTYSNWYGRWNGYLLNVPGLPNAVPPICPDEYLYYYVDLNSIKTFKKGLLIFKSKAIGNKNSTITNYTIDCKKKIITPLDYTIYENNKFCKKGKFEGTFPIQIDKIEEIDSQVVKGEIHTLLYIDKVYIKYYQTVCK